MKQAVDFPAHHSTSDPAPRCGICEDTIRVREHPLHENEADTRSLAEVRLRPWSIVDVAVVDACSFLVGGGQTIGTYRSG